MVKTLPKKYELLLKLEKNNPYWFMEIADDDERLIELREAWKSEAIPPERKDKKPKRIKWNHEKIAELFSQGLSATEIAKVLNVKRSALYGYLSRKGITAAEMRKKYARKKRK